MLRSNDLTIQPILQPRTRGIARPLRVRVVAAEELSQDAYDRWGEIQDADPALASPYFSPDFTLRVADVWANVQVAIIESGERQVGFLPFQRRGRTGLPIGARLNHAEGAVVERGVEFDPIDLVRACGLREYRFSMMPDWQAAFVPFSRVTCQAPYIDLSAGYDAYVQDHRARHSAKWFASRARLLRKLERDAGTLRFTYHTPDPAAFETAIRLKTAQFRRHNNLTDASYMRLFRHLRETPTARCSVTVSALEVDDQQIAAQIAIGSPTVLGPIVIGYDPTFGRYSPGSLLMLMVAEEAARRGIVKYDLSGGEQSWKFTWMSDAERFIDGFVATNPLTAAQRAGVAACRIRKFQLLNHGVLGPERRLGRGMRQLSDRIDSK
jgi:CelD/BcsL family acetyltransferase involved in cellulose biosynthesis